MGHEAQNNVSHIKEGQSMTSKFSYFVGGALTGIAGVCAVAVVCEKGAQWGASLILKRALKSTDCSSGPGKSPRKTHERLGANLDHLFSQAGEGSGESAQS